MALVSGLGACGLNLCAIHRAGLQEPSRKRDAAEESPGADLSIEPIVYSLEQSQCFQLGWLEDELRDAVDLHLEAGCDCPELVELTFDSFA